MLPFNTIAVIIVLTHVAGDYLLQRSSVHHDVQPGVRGDQSGIVKSPQTCHSDTRLPQVVSQSHQGIQQAALSCVEGVTQEG